MAQPVQILDPSGQLGTIDPSELPHAESMGYRIPTAQDLEQINADKTYGGTGQGVLAGAEGLASTWTGGLSRVIENSSGFTTPEAQKGRQLAHPAWSGGGELAAIPLAFLAPEGAAVGEALEALNAAKAAGTGVAEATSALSAARGALNAGDLVNPIRGISKVAGGITEGVAPGVGKIAGLLANPETSPIANKILTKAGAGAIGSAIEALPYVGGQAVSESALGDPDALGEGLISNLGFGALMGGALGAVLHGAMAPFAKSEINAASHSISDAGARDIPGMAESALGKADNFHDAVAASTMPQAQKQGLLDGLSRLKSNVPEIDEAASRLGVQTFPAQRSDSEFLQNRYGMATQSPSPFGVSEAQKIQQASQDVAGKVEQTLGKAPILSDAELGNALKKGITEKLQTELDPISDLYENKIKPLFKSVPLSEAAVKEASSGILKLEDLVNADGKPLSASSPQYAFAKRVSEEVGGLKSVDDLKRYKTLVRSDTYGVPSLKNVGMQIQERLSALEDNSILRFANDNLNDTETKAAAQNAIGLRKEADARYSALRDKMAELGDVAGKRKIYGPKDLINFINDGITPESLGKRVMRTANNNSEALGFLQKEFPDQFEAIKGQIKGSIKEAATKDGSLNLTRAQKEIDKLSPEAKKMFFGKDEIQTLKDAKTWQDAWPKKWGPSGTPQGIQYLDFFKNPITGTGMAARDYAALKFANHFAGTGDAAPKIAGLAHVERMAQKTASAIESAAKGIFKVGKEVGPIAAGMSASSLNPEEFQKRKERLLEAANNPDKMLDQLHKGTEQLYSIAPNTAASVQMAAARATQFLASKLPSPGPAAPLSPPVEPSQSEIAKFNRYYSVVEDPKVVLDQVALATITPESIETLQTVYPKLLSQMQQSVMDKLTTHIARGNDISYAKKMSLSMFLGKDMVNSLNQPNISASQIAIMGDQSQNQNEIQAPSGGKKKVPTLAKLTKSERLLTDTQSTAERGDA